jgi:hypothetical protein
MSTFTGKVVVGLFILLVITTCGGVSGGYGGFGGRNNQGGKGSSFVVQSPIVTSSSSSSSSSSSFGGSSFGFSSTQPGMSSISISTQGVLPQIQNIQSSISSMIDCISNSFWNGYTCAPSTSSISCSYGY